MRHNSPAPHAVGNTQSAADVRSRRCYRPRRTEALPRTHVCSSSPPTHHPLHPGATTLLTTSCEAYAPCTAPKEFFAHPDHRGAVAGGR